MSAAGMTVIEAATAVGTSASRCPGHQHEPACRRCGARRSCCLPECSGIRSGVCAGACPERRRSVRASSLRFADACSDPHLALMHRPRVGR